MVLAYPYLLDAVIPLVGERGAASALLLLSASLLWIPRGRPTAVPPPAAALRVSVPLLLLAAVATGRPIYLQLVPSLVYWMLADTFRGSLRAEDSLIERGARFLVPEAPSFIRGYCRKVTRLWVWFFAASGACIALFAFAGNHVGWEWFTGRLVCAAMVAITVVEFFVRKTWFRYYYHDGPFDRCWAKLFPAENTERGRRSLAYIAHVRAAASGSISHDT